MKNQSTILFAILLIIPVQNLLAQNQVANVVTSPVIKKNLSEVQSYVGTIHPEKKSIVGSAVDGRIAEFPIDEGDFIQKGKPLAQLLTKTISLELDAAKSELKLKQEELNELENGSREEDISRAHSLMQAAKTADEYQKNRIKRMETLFSKQTINEDEIQKARSDAIKTKYIYEETLSAYNLMKEGPRKEKIAQARASVEIQKAIVDKLADQLKKHTIICPFDGFVIREHTELGEWVNRGDPVAEVVKLDEVNLVVQVLDTQVLHMKTGVTVEVEIPAIKDRRFKGYISKIIPQADVRSRTFPVVVRLKNKITNNEPYLKSGMLIRAFLPSGPEQPATMVPKDALVLGKGKPILMVVDRKSKDDKNGIVRVVEVQLGTSSGEWIEVTSGNVKEDEHVVVRGNERLRNGQPVQISDVLQPPVQTGQASEEKKIN